MNSQRGNTGGHGRGQDGRGGRGYGGFGRGGFGEGSQGGRGGGGRGRGRSNSSGGSAQDLQAQGLPNGVELESEIQNERQKRAAIEGAIKDLRKEMEEKERQFKEERQALVLRIRADAEQLRRMREAKERQQEALEEAWALGYKSAVEDQSISKELSYLARANAVAEEGLQRARGSRQRLDEQLRQVREFRMQEDEVNSSDDSFEQEEEDQPVHGSEADKGSGS